MYRSLPGFAALVGVLVLVLAVSCSIDDEDRCVDGQHWDPDALVCKLCDTDQTWDPEAHECVSAGGDSDADADADADGGADGGDGPPTGLGEPCDSDEDCEGYEASLCAINPLTEEGQYCTLENCEPADCPDGWQCCDCMAVSALESVACAKDEDVSALTFGGCTCS